MTTSNFHRDSEQIYDPVARFLHWLIVALIALQFVVGWTMPGVHRDTQPVGLIAWHLGIGATLIAAVALRIIWRITHRPPPHRISPALGLASRFTHLLLYVALVAVPLLGWANASSRNWTVPLFGVVPLPPLTQAGSAFGHACGDIHSIAAWILLALIGLHVAAALFHHFVLKDKVLRRMMP